jgi:hypothetical protein
LVVGAEVLMSQSDMRDEAYPDGSAWRCAADGCDFATESDELRCPRHGERYEMYRVNRRITWGPLPRESRNVVVEHR